MAADGLWDGVDRLVDRLEPEQASRHGLGPLAAVRLRRRGAPVPEQLVRDERAARALSLVAPVLLARAREAYDGDLLLLKGPELVRRYPEGARRFADLDLLTPDPERAQAALLAAGFRLPEDVPPLDYDSHHHLHPLEWPGLALRIEIHRRVAWPAGLHPPRNEELFEAAVPARGRVGGILVPDPDHHALLLAAHAWQDVPMRTARELVDVLAFTDDASRDRLVRLARRWGFERGWAATLAAADWLLRDGREPYFVRVWARYLRRLREPSLLELHLQEWLAPFSLARPWPAVRLAAAAALRDLRPAPHESWREKAQRARLGLARPFASQSAHERRSSGRV